MYLRSLRERRKRPRCRPKAHDRCVGGWFVPPPTSAAINPLFFTCPYIYWVSQLVVARPAGCLLCTEEMEYGNP